MVIDPAIESHYGTGYERSRLFPGGRPSPEFVRSVELLERLRAAFDNLAITRRIMGSRTTM